MKTVPEMLEDAAKIYEERGKVYGKNYLHFGPIMVALFPNGLVVKTADDWRRVGIFVQIMAKISRYAESFATGGHDDSMRDNSVYSMMMREVDNIARENKENAERVHIRHRDNRPNKKRTNAVKPAT